MKIDGSGTDPLGRAIERVVGPTGPAANPTASQRAASAAADHVQVSAEAHLLQNALRLADEQPDVRPDVVERMRAALNDGRIGQDAGALADALIDAWMRGE